MPKVCNHLLADGQRKTSVDGAAVSRPVVVREQVSIRASGVAGSADGRGARGGCVSGLNRKAILGELGVRAHVDARQVPEDGVDGLGVLELQHILLVGVGRQLDGDTTSVGVELPGLGVDTTVGGENQHGTGDVGHGPGVDVDIQVVGNQNGTASSDVVAADLVGQAVRERGGHGSEGGSNAESLGEHHLDQRVYVEDSELKNVVIGR